MCEFVNNEFVCVNPSPVFDAICYFLYSAGVPYPICAHVADLPQSVDDAEHH